MITSPFYLIKTLAKRRRLIVRDEATQETTPTALEQTIIDFDHRDDISRTLPGRKDEIHIKVDGEKTAVAKCFLTLTLGEVHALFQAEYEGTFTVARTTFF